MVTEVPTGPVRGVKDVMVGALNVKLAALVAVPPGVVTAMVPLDAPGGTVAVACVALTTANVAAAMPLNLTADTPVRFVPVIVTEVPTGPVRGVKDVKVGALTGVVAASPPPLLQLNNIKPDARKHKHKARL